MSILFKILYLIFFLILAVTFIKFALAFLLIAIVLLWLRTWQMKKEPNQQDFLNGKLPNPPLDGLYQGSMGFPVSWVGKKFSAHNSTGINVLKDKKGNQYEKYPFK